MLLFALYQLTPSNDTGVLSHLRWRVLDKLDDVLLRATIYTVVNIVVTELFRSIITFHLPILVRVANHPRAESGGDDDDDVLEDDAASFEHRNDHDDDVSSTLSDDLEDPNESTPLVKGAAASSRKERAKRFLFSGSPVAIASIVGLLIGTIPFLKDKLVQADVEVADRTWIWKCFGVALVVMGQAFPVVELLGIGAGLKAGSSKRKADQVIPPTLGVVLLLTVWRYLALPAVTIAIMYGMRKTSTRVFLYDPVFSFVIATASVSPPTLPAQQRLGPYRASIHTQLTWLALITPVALSSAIAVAGRGVSYENNFDLKKTLYSALGGGAAGAAAMIIQVLTLMPLRTMMNYQYRHGGSFKSSAKTLWNEGKIPRYYAGLGAAIFQGPLSRFGDTAANAGIFALLESLTWPVLVKTIAASAASAAFRMTLTPIDTIKTTQQTQGGRAGMILLKNRIKEKGIASMWYGAFATAGATFVGHYPWFGTYNWLSANLPPPHNLIQKLARQAFIGFAASVVSDTVSNSLRVIKTYRQVHEGDMGYVQAAREIIDKDGWRGLFGRGLATRLLTNGLQGLLFSILWKLFADL